MGSVYRQRELNTRPGGRKNKGGARPGAGRPAVQADQRAAAYGGDPGWRGSAAQRDRHAGGQPQDQEAHRRRDTAAAFPDELCQAKAKVSLILGTSLLGKARAGDNGAIGMLARNHWGWDRPGATTMALSVPSANGDIGDDTKIIIEMVRARKRDENGDFIE